MQIFSIGFCADLPRLQILFVNLHFTGFQKQQWHHPWLAFAVMLQVVAVAAIKAGYSRIDQKMDSMIVMETNEANESCWLSFPISVTFEMQ